MDINGKPNNIVDFLCSLHQGQWFGFNNKENIYKNLVILDDTKTKPTEQECIDGLVKLQADYDQAIINRNNKRSSGKQKLKDLGLTDDEVEALLWVI